MHCHPSSTIPQIGVAGRGPLGLDDQNLQHGRALGALIDPAKVDPGQRPGTGISAELVDPVGRGEPDDGSCPRRAPPECRPARPRPPGSRVARRPARGPRAGRHRGLASRGTRPRRRPAPAARAGPPDGGGPVAIRRTPDVATAQLRSGSASQQARPRRAAVPLAGGLGLLRRNERLHLRLGIQVRRGHPDGLERAAAMADPQERLGPSPRALAHRRHCCST